MWLEWGMGYGVWSALLFVIIINLKFQVYNMSHSCLIYNGNKNYRDGWGAARSCGQ